MTERTKIQRSSNMSKIRGVDTSFEILLRSKLYKRGIRYRKNDRSIFGVPDIALKGIRLAIFIDSEFWHRHDFLKGKNIPKTNTQFWIDKFKGNIKRDEEVTTFLAQTGWVVVRILTRQLNLELDQVCDELTDLILFLKNHGIAEPRRKYKQKIGVLRLYGDRVASARRQF